MSVYPLKILSPEKKLFDGKVSALTVTCENGGMTVLAGHAPMLAALVEGPITIHTPHETIEGVAGHGVLRVGRKETAVMVYSFRRAGDEAAKETAPEEADALDTMLL